MAAKKKASKKKATKKKLDIVMPTIIASEFEREMEKRMHRLESLFVRSDLNTINGIEHHQQVHEYRLRVLEERMNKILEQVLPRVTAIEEWIKARAEMLIKEGKG